MEGHCKNQKYRFTHFELEILSVPIVGIVLELVIWLPTIFSKKTIWNRKKILSFVPRLSMHQELGVCVAFISTFLYFNIEFPSKFSSFPSSITFESHNVLSNCSKTASNFSVAHINPSFNCLISLLKLISFLIVWTVRLNECILNFYKLFQFTC